MTDIFDKGNAAVFDYPSIAACVNRKPQPDALDQAIDVVVVADAKLLKVARDDLDRRIQADYKRQLAYQGATDKQKVSALAAEIEANECRALGNTFWFGSSDFWVNNGDGFKKLEKV